MPRAGTIPSLHWCNSRSWRESRARPARAHSGEVLRRTRATAAGTVPWISAALSPAGRPGVDDDGVHEWLAPFAFRRRLPCVNLSAGRERGGRCPSRHPQHSGIRSITARENRPFHARHKRLPRVVSDKRQTVYVGGLAGAEPLGAWPQRQGVVAGDQRRGRPGRPRQGRTQR